MQVKEMIPFCTKIFEGRDSLREPFTIDGFTYATNGHIAVRVPVIEGVKIATEQPGSIVKMFQWEEEIVFKQMNFEIPVFTRTIERCWGCKNIGEVHCDTCTCPDEYEDSGWACDELCKDGQMIFEEAPSILVKKTPFDAIYIRLIKHLPGLLVDSNYGDPASMEHFRFTFLGGHGLLMPLREGSETRKIRVG